MSQFIAEATSFEGTIAELVGAEREGAVARAGSDKSSDVEATVTRELIEAGLAGVPAAISRTSTVHPTNGVTYGVGPGAKPIGELAGKSLEHAIALLALGREARGSESDEIAALVQSRRVPDELWPSIEAFPTDRDPMRMLNAAIWNMDAPAWDAYVASDLGDGDWWRPILRDGLSYIGIGVELIGYFMRHVQGLSRVTDAPPDGSDLGASLAHYLGIAQGDDHHFAQVAEVARTTLLMYAAHGAANVGNFASFATASTLPSPREVITGGGAALSGRRHGRAASDVLIQLERDLYEHFAGTAPDRGDFKAYLRERTAGSERLPKEKRSGIGHRVLKALDARCALQIALGERFCPDNPIFEMAMMQSEIMPEILEGKTDQRFANVDNLPGPVWRAIGLFGKEPGHVSKDRRHWLGILTAMFAVSRMSGWVLEAVRSGGPRLIRPRGIPTLVHAAATT